jgi:aarF domain-containing kinase
MFAVVSRPLLRATCARGILRPVAGRGIVALARSVDRNRLAAHRQVCKPTTLDVIHSTARPFSISASLSESATTEIPIPPPPKRISRAPRTAAARYRRRLAYLLAFLGITYISYEYIPPARHLLVALIRCTRLMSAVTLNIIDYKWMFAKHYDPSVYTEEEIKEFRRADRRECHKRSAGRLFEALKRNAGIYVKLGQHISSIQALPKE